MSDKYYVHDCQTHGHGCQNTYTMLYTASERVIDDAKPQMQRGQKQPVSWWARLMGRKPVATR